MDYLNGFAVLKYSRKQRPSSIYLWFRDSVTIPHVAFLSRIPLLVEMGHIPVSPSYSYPASHLKNIPLPTTRLNFKLRREFCLQLNLCWTLIDDSVDYTNVCKPLLWTLRIIADHFYKRNRRILTIKPWRTVPRDSFSFECWCPWNVLQHFTFTQFLPWTNRWSYPNWDAK